MTKADTSAKRGPSILSFLIMLVLVVGAFAYLSFTAYSRDALWFWPYFDETPDSIVVRCYEEKVAVPHDSQEFTELTRLVNAQLSGDKQWQEMTLSDESFEAYLADPSMAVLEMMYSAPVDVHTGTAMFLSIDTLLTPLAGRFANENFFFGARQERHTGGLVHVKDTQPIKDYINQSGLCVLK